MLVSLLRAEMSLILPFFVCVSGKNDSDSLSSMVSKMLGPIPHSAAAFDTMSENEQNFFTYEKG